MLLWLLFHIGDNQIVLIFWLCKATSPPTSSSSSGHSYEASSPPQYLNLHFCYKTTKAAQLLQGYTKDSPSFDFYRVFLASLIYQDLSPYPHHTHAQLSAYLPPHSILWWCSCSPYSSSSVSTHLPSTDVQSTQSVRRKNNESLLLSD